jgi:hypothetical protein
MDQALEKPKVLFLRRAPDSLPEGETPMDWGMFRKALGTVCAVEERDWDGQPIADPATLGGNFQHVFLEFALAPWSQLAKAKVPNLCLVRGEMFPWVGTDMASEAREALAQHSCLVVGGIGTSDLVRILHLYLLPKRLAGAAALMEKGAVIVGEKLLTIDSLGRLLDSLNAYLKELGNFELAARLPDLRLVLSSLIFEAHHWAQKATSVYPSVDFQAAASAKKLAINLRFAKNGLNGNDLPRKALNGESLFWQQIWRCSDVLLITDHEAHGELEVMVLINAAEPSLNSYRSLLFRTSNNSARKENYLEAPQSYTFKILSEIRPKETDVLVIEGKDKNDELDLGGLPEPVLKKLAKLAEHTSFLEEQAKRKDEQIQEFSTKLQATKQDLSAKRSEAIRMLKAREVELEGVKRQLATLTEEAAALKKSLQAASAPKEKDNSPALQETIGKLEASLRAAESEKSQLKENISNEQKKVTVFEQKYSNLYKDMMGKDKEINDLKSALLKVRKEQTSESAKAAGPAKDDASKLLKEAETKEAAAKQELKKLNFKIETQEKTIKAIQAEMADKAKLMEKTLQAAKTKEVELLKKVEELTAALKKAAKSAA